MWLFISSSCIITVLAGLACISWRVWTNQRGLSKTPLTVEELVFPASYAAFQETFSPNPANDNGYPPVVIERGDLVAAFGEHTYLVVQAVDTEDGVVWCLPYNERNGNAKALPRPHPIANICVFSKAQNANTTWSPCN